jgi:tetratricopeptide (TPR) repeat protein
MSRSALSRKREVRQRLVPVCDKAKAIWAKPVLRQYTDHTIRHSARVIDLIDSLTALLRGQDRLNNNEAYVVFSAALLHDVGMQCEIFYEKGFLHDLFSPKELAAARDDKNERDRLLRTRHHDLGAEWIRHELGAQCLVRDYIEDVADVALAHTGDSLAALRDHEEEGQWMRLRLLASLLRLADELDLDRRRVDLDELQWADIPPASKAHWWKCHYVQSVRIDHRGFIRVTFQFSDKDDLQVQENVPRLVLDNLKQKMEQDGLGTILFGYGLPLRLAEPQTLKSAKGPSKTPIPQEILAILLSEYSSLAREQLARQTLQPQRQEVPEGRALRPREITVPAQTEQSALQQARNLWAHGAAVQAIETLQRAAAAYPGSAPVQAMLGDLLLSRGQWRAAETAGRKAVESQFGNFLAHLTLGVTLGHRGQHKKALEHLRITDLTCHSMPVAARYHARVHMAIARSLAALGDYWYAVERIDSADALSPPSGAEAADQADRELGIAATSVRKTAQGMTLETGTWEIAKSSFQDVLGEWAKRPVVRFERLRTLMEGMTLAGSSTWVDYVFDCDFQLVNLAAGFLLRADAWATSGLMAQIIPGKLRIHQMLHSNYFAGPLIEVDLPTPLRLYQWYRVRFDVSGSSLVTSIDDRLVGEPSQLLPVYASGKVGFRLWGREFTLYKNPRVTITKKWVPRQL